jgi:hypothetical protein
VPIGVFGVVGVLSVWLGVFSGFAWGLPSGHAFEIVPGSFNFGPSGFEAGAHSDWVTSFDFAHEADGSTYNDVRNIVVKLPAGFDASNTAVPTCTEAQLLEPNPAAGTVEIPDCPVASQIGELSVEAFANPNKSTVYQLTLPVYNMEPATFGTAAELGFQVGGFYTGTSVVSVRPTDTGITVATSNVAKIGESHNARVVVWAFPASHEHDSQRGVICGSRGEIPPVCRNEFGSVQEAGIPVKPFLSNPTSCGVFGASMEAESWEEPGTDGLMPAQATDDLVGPIVECGRVPFEPSIEVQPTTRSAESPTGLNVSLIVPQAWENQFSLSTANLKSTKVALPEGMTANPSVAAGLGACTPAEYASETSSSLPGEGCPPESKIGSIEIETPILAEKILGAVYIAQPYDNPFGEPGHPNGSLLALYVVAKDPQRGILLKVAGKIEPNPVTGQLVTTFTDTPQQPFSRFTLKFRPGATAPLVSPPACGTFTTTSLLEPWSHTPAPGETAGTSDATPSNSFTVTQGVHEGTCPSGGVPPLKPTVVAGTNNNAGGSYSPFYLRLLREDGEQELTKFSTVMPPGLTGNLSGIPFCPETDIEAAKNVSGDEELAHPSCPAASEIGHTIVSAGVGTVLAQTPGKVYLAGPYHGAPLSLVAITSATVGPFDLGTVVIRFALKVNPITAQVEVDSNGSDPIPHIIRGIVVHVREIHVYIDRPKFILNPTNCSMLSIENTVVGAGADYTNPADQTSVNVNSPFEAADCSSLAFKPTLKVTTNGKTSRVKGASLTAKLTYPNAPQGTQTDIAKVKVDLPKQLPSRLSTLQKACLYTTFEANPAACPTGSIVGHAKAITPILPVPLEGPAYFVSHGGAKFPELIIVLQGYGITIDLHSETFINKKGITSSTFRTVPDQPVTSFELTLPQGPDSALAANKNLCQTKLTMPTAYTAQNGTEIHTSTTIHTTNCPKKRNTSKNSKNKH